MPEIIPLTMRDYVIMKDNGSMVQFTDGEIVIFDTTIEANEVSKSFKGSKIEPTQRLSKRNRKILRRNIKKYSYNNCPF